jgi:hypothetical protein
MDSIEKRKFAGEIYCILGVGAIFSSIFLICPRFLICLFNAVKIPMLWCVGWSLVGGGAGLINTRDHPQDKPLHLIGYWGFVLLTISIFSFVASLYVSNEYPNLGVRFYSLSALLGLIGGFLGSIFRDLVLKILDKAKLSQKNE